METKKKRKNGEGFLMSMAAFFCKRKREKKVGNCTKGKLILYAERCIHIYIILALLSEILALESVILT